HVEGHGVARLGAVERHRHHAAVLLDEDGLLVAHGPDDSAPEAPPATLDAMLARLTDLLWPRARATRLHVAAEPADVLLPSGIVLRTLGAAAARRGVRGG